MFNAGTGSSRYVQKLVKGYSASTFVDINSYSSDSGSVSIVFGSGYPTYSTIVTTQNGSKYMVFGTQSAYDTVGNEYLFYVNYYDSNDSRGDAIIMDIVDNVVNSTQIPTIELVVPYDPYTVYLGMYNTVSYGTVSYNLVSTYSNLIYDEFNKSIYIDIYTDANTGVELNQLHATQSIIYTTNNENGTNLATHSFDVSYYNPYALVLTSPVNITYPFNLHATHSYDLLNNLTHDAAPELIDITFIGLPSIATYITTGYNKKTKIVIGTTSYNDIGTYNFAFNAINAAFYQLTGTGSINIIDNIGYIINNTYDIHDISTYGGETFSYDIMSLYSGIDNKIKNVSVPSWLTCSTQGVLSGFPTAADIDSYTVSYNIYNELHSLDDEIYVTVLDNTLFETNSVTTQNIIGGQYFTYGISNNYTTTTGSIYYNMTSIPSWLTFSGGNLYGTPSVSDVGSDSVHYTVTNNFRTFNRNLPLNVIDNTITITHSIPNQVTYVTLTNSVNLGSYYSTYTGSLYISGTNFPNWLTYSGLTISGQPQLGDVGTYTVGYTISNGFRSIYDDYIVNVRNANVTKISSQTISNGIVGVYYTGSILLSKYSTEVGTISVSTYSFPSWLNYSLTSSIYSGTNNNVGTYSATITVTNGIKTYTDSLQFVTSPSTLTKVKYHNPVSVNSGSFFEYVMRMDEYESNYNSVTVATISKPSWVTYYDTNYTLAGIPTQLSIGNNIVTYSVTNGRNTLVDYVYITVNDTLNVNLLQYPYDVTFKHINSISFNVNWKKPISVNNLYSMVVVSDDVNADLSYPTVTNYIANINFDLAPSLPINLQCDSNISSGTSSWKVVYNGLDTSSVTVIGLKPMTEYKVAIFNYTSDYILTCNTSVYSVETESTIETNAISFSVNTANSNKVISNAIIKIYDRFNNIVSILTTDDNGRALSDPLETECSYRIVVEKVGYIKYDRSGFYNREDYTNYNYDITSIDKWNSRNRTTYTNKGQQFLNNKNHVDISMIKIV